MFRIYNKEEIPKEIFNINLSKKEVDEIFKGNLFIDHPSLNKEDYIVLEKENPFIHPILDNGVLREKTREELVLIDNKLELLQDGEYVEAGEIIVVEAPKDLLRPKWNRDLNIWVEGMTKEELIEIRKNKILEYSKLEDEKRILEGSKFPIDEEIKAITERMAILEVDINNIAEKIKLL